MTWSNTNSKSFCVSSDYKEYHTDTTVKFVVSMTTEQLNKAEDEGFYKKFKLESNMLLSNIVRHFLFEYNSLSLSFMEY